MWALNFVIMQPELHVRPKVIGTSFKTGAFSEDLNQNEFPLKIAGSLRFCLKVGK